MRDAEGVPEDDVGIFDAFVAVRCDPSWQTLRRFAGGLRDMAASGVDLVVVVCRWLILAQLGEQTVKVRSLENSL